MLEIKFIQNLSFRLKLLLIGIPPLLGLIFYALMFVFTLINEKNNLEVNKSEIYEIEVLAKIVHFMQMERGLSVGFVSSNGTKNSEKIVEVRAKISNALNEIKDISEKTKSNDKVSSHLAELSQKRAQIDSLKIGTSDVAMYLQKP